MFWVLAVLMACLAALQASSLINQRYGQKQKLLAQGRSEVHRAAQAVDAGLKELEPRVQALVEDLEAGRLAPDRIAGRLEKDLENTPGVFRLGVVFSPIAQPKGGRVPASFAVRDPGGVRVLPLDPAGGYEREDWFWEGMDHDGWGEPFLSGPMNERVVGYSLRFRPPGSKVPGGMVRLDLSLEQLRERMGHSTIGQTGYTCLLSVKGVYMVHPRREWVNDLRTTFQSSEAEQDPLRWSAGEWAFRKERNEGEGASTMRMPAKMLFAEPVPASGWSLQAVLFLNELEQNPTDLRRGIVRLGCLLLAVAGCLGLGKAGNGGARRNKILLSVLLAAGTAMLWGLTLALPDPPPDDATPILGFENLEVLTGGAPTLRIPTGIYLDTLRFGDTNNVVITGRAWQRFPPGYPKGSPRGFFFPDAEDGQVQETVHTADASGDLQEYAFKANLRQEFDNSYKYPFDHAVIHLRVLPQDAVHRVALVPDLRAYALLNPAALPGLGKGLVIPGWDKEKSYFGFLNAAYTTDFGMAQPSGGLSRELSYQVVLSRKFMDPFISAMLPLIVVACLLHTLLLAGSRAREGNGDLKAIETLAGAATLLFPVIYAQISLRSRISVSGLIYMEYLYFVMYAVILLISANALGFTLGKGARIIQSKDNDWAKQAYWPVILGSFFTISILFLY